MTYRLVPCPRPGCTKQHGVVSTPRRAARLASTAGHPSEASGNTPPAGSAERTKAELTLGLGQTG